MHLFLLKSEHLNTIILFFEIFELSDKFLSTLQFVYVFLSSRVAEMLLRHRREDHQFFWHLLFENQ